MDALSTVGAVEAGLLCAKCKYASNQVYTVLTRKWKEAAGDVTQFAPPSDQQRESAQGEVAIKMWRDKIFFHQ